MLTSKQVREKYMKFWIDRGHAPLPDVSLVPQNDPSLLFVNSGMFPLANYLSGEEEHPLGTRLVNIQRCLRTKYDEMLEVGDNRHTLMFEMIGNWSLNDYFKKEEIPWVLKLHVEEFGLDPHRIYISVWGGDGNTPRDDEAINIWKEAFREYGVEAEFSEDITEIPQDIEAGKTHKARIFPYGKSDNWWQRAEAVGELGGTSSELFYDTGIIENKQEKYHINDDSGRFLEIGNSVFMQYKLNENMQWEKINRHNIDYGGGLERVVMCIQGKNDIFETDIYEPILQKIAEISNKEYKLKGEVTEDTRNFRILADHSRAATFILADGVMPSNKDQGYILRRFIRRLVRYGNSLGIERNFTRELAINIIEHMSDIYPHLENNKAFIVDEIEKEEIKFRRTLERGLREFEKIRGRGEKIDGEKAFWFYETYGFPLEMIIEELGDIDEDRAKQIEIDFAKARKTHQEKSRAGAEQKFTGGLADHSDETTRLHTAHHLLLAALQKVLGNHVHQRGSNITNARLRIDFSHNGGMSDEEIKRVEDIVNEKIKEGWIVEKQNMPKAKAEELGAEMEFGQKYGDLVSVYSIKHPETDEIFSMEFCGGPHVENTSELAKSGEFKIVKEKSSGAGVRRIKAILE